MRKLLCLALLSLWIGLPAFGAPARLPENAVIERVVVKFHEGTAVRLRGGMLAAQSRDERDRRDLAARGISPAAVDGDLAEVHRLAPQGIGRLFLQEERALAERRARGESRSGRKLADLDLYYELRVTPGTRAGEVADLLDALNALGSVETAYAEPPPALPVSPPATPDFQSMQGYLDPAPEGIDALYAWTQAGGTGEDVKIVDVEGGWRTTHEDMPPLFHTGGTQINSWTWVNHGTAVLGEMVAKNNGIGVTGIVYDAQAGYESIGNQSVASAILNAGTAAGEGGLVLIELHSLGPDSSSVCTCNFGQCMYVAMEYFQANYDAIANLTANGTLVVEAAGNGSTNLDDPVYGGAFDRNVRDSGAILVAASNSFDRAATCWTNWGSRIDLHGWGGSVTTLGYGDLYSGGSEDSWYTSSFSGTSSASPIVTGAAASLQGRALATQGIPLDPFDLRDLLASTGTDYIGTKNIGLLPDLKTAFESLGGEAPPCYALTRTHTGSGTDPVSSRTSSAGCPAGQFRAGTKISFTASPAPGWTIAGWTGTINDASKQKTNSVTMPAAAHTVSVTYEEIADVLLSNGVTRTDTFEAEAPQGTWRFYYVDLEAGSGILRVDLFGLSGDVDLYVRRGAKPTLADWDCRPFGGGASNETCAFGAPAAGRWYIGVANSPAGTFTYSVKASWIPAPVAADFYSVEPCRAVDTRLGAPLSSEIPRTFTIAGTCGIPASAKGVAVNVTAVTPASQGYVVMWPGDLGTPLTSVLSFPAGRTRASQAILRLATDGTGTLAARGSLAGGGTVHLLVDVTGYFE